MSRFHSFKEITKRIDHDSNIKTLLKEKNLNPKIKDDLKYLLSLTINPIIKSFNSKYLLSFLLKYLNSENKSLFYENFLQSCELGKMQNIKILLEGKIDVNCQNELGETPLHIAIAKNDIELIALLIKYEPKTNIPTYQDNLNAVNYAEICGNKKIIKMIKELNESYKKRKIKNEIVDYINGGMNNIKNEINSTMNDISNNDIFKDSSYSFISKNNTNLEQIQNYNGEKISIITSSDMNNSILTNHLNKNISNTKIGNFLENKYLNTQTIINESDYEENECKNKKKVIFNYNHSSNERQKKSKQITNESKLFSSSIKKKEELGCHNNLSNNPSYIQSLRTCHSLNRDNLEILSAFPSHISLKQMNKKDKITKFIEEINLPKKYVNCLLDNGFDDLDVLISQTKKGIALPYQNLKDIGIALPGERSKIIIHLEEISGNFDFYLDKNIIYSNKVICNSNSLYKFLCAINLEKLFDNFKDSGFYNVELLLVQMCSKQPMNETILIDDLRLNKFESKKILENLIKCSRNYINQLKNIGNNRNYEDKNIILEEKNNIQSCDMCFCF